MANSLKFPNRDEWLKLKGKPWGEACRHFTRDPAIIGVKKRMRIDCLFLVQATPILLKSLLMQPSNRILTGPYSVVLCFWQRYWQGRNTHIKWLKSRIDRAYMNRTASLIKTANWCCVRTSSSRFATQRILGNTTGIMMVYRQRSPVDSVVNCTGCRGYCRGK